MTQKTIFDENIGRISIESILGNLHAAASTFPYTLTHTEEPVNLGPNIGIITKPYTSRLANDELLQTISNLSISSDSLRKLVEKSSIEKQEEICDLFLSTPRLFLEWKLDVIGYFESFCKIFPLERTKLFNFVCENNMLYSSLTKTFDFFLIFINIFSNESERNIDIEDYILQHQCENNFHHLFNYGSNFKGIFKIFVYESLEENKRQYRIEMLLNYLEQIPALYSNLFSSEEKYTQFILDFPYAKQEIMYWLRSKGIINADQSIISNKLDNLIEKNRIEKHIKQIRKEEKNTWRNSNINYNGLDETSNDLHQLANSYYLDEAQSQRAITLLEQEKGKNLHELNGDGRTPLSIASFKGHSKLLLIFLSWGAKTNIKDKTHYLPRFFKVSYSCDHEFDEDACIPFKHFMDKSKRLLLRKLSDLERKYVCSETPYFTFETIKEEIFCLLSLESLKFHEVRAAVCGYVINNLQEEERLEALYELNDYLLELDPESSLSYETVYHALPKEYFTELQERNARKALYEYSRNIISANPEVSDVETSHNQATHL